MKWHGKDLRGFLHRAADVIFDNTNTGLSATNVQGAIDEVCSNLSDYIIYRTSNLTASFNGEETKVLTFNIPSVSGYKPILAFASYCDNTRVLPYSISAGLSSSDTTYTLGFRNTSTNAVSDVAVRSRVIYIRNI